MAWEWVAPLATATAAAVGVAGTYWTARQGRESAVLQAREQRAHSVQERTHAEKRAAYLGFLEAIQLVRQTRTQIKALPRTPEQRAKRRELRDTALAELSLRRSHLRLAAPPDVRTLANRAHRHLVEVLAGAVAGEKAVVDTQHTSALLAAMKQDLGYELARSDLTALAQDPVAPDAETREVEASDVAQSELGDPAGDVGGDSLRTEAEQ